MLFVSAIERAAEGLPGRGWPNRGDRLCNNETGLAADEAAFEADRATASLLDVATLFFNRANWMGKLTLYPFEIPTAVSCRHGCDHSSSWVNSCPIDGKPEFSGGGMRVVSALVSR